MISRRKFIKRIVGFIGVAAVAPALLVKPAVPVIKPVSAPKYKWIREDTNLLSSGFAPSGTRLKKVRI